MASVQELIAAAEQNKSPFIKLLEGAAQGFGQAQTGGLDRTIKLMQLDQMRQEQEQQRQMQEQINQQLAIQTEQQTKQGLKTVGGEPRGVMPTQKLKQKISQDEKGRYSRSVEIINDGSDDAKLLPEKYIDAQGKTRIGKWHPQQGLLQSPDDPTASQGVPDKSMSREITKAKVSLAKTRPMVDSVISEIDRVQKLNENSYGGKIGALKVKAMSATELGTDSEKFKNTADAVNTMQSQVAKVLKSTFGGQLSDGEREYLNGVYGALPSLSRSERSIAMTNVKKMLQAKLEGDAATLQELLDDAGISSGGGEENADPMGLGL